MLERRKKGKPRKSPAGIVPGEMPVFSALERAGWVVVIGEKPDGKPAKKPKRPR